MEIQAPRLVFQLRSLPSPSTTKNKPICRPVRRCKLLVGLAFFTFVFAFYHLMTFQFPLREYFSASIRDDLEPLCIPKKSVVFLKTHKTAGSTVQNIFMRYADTHGLLVALPTPDNYFGHPESFKRSMVPRLKPGYSYHILCHHARFNYPELRHVVSNNATLVTILRDPAQLFESLYSYYKLQGYFNLSLEEFALAKRSTQLLHSRRINRKIGRNQMMFDLGFHELHFDDDDMIRRYIEYLDRTFHLVMIAERMDESLVLLRDLLCWQPEDIVMFKHNVRLPEKKRRMEPRVEEGLRQWNRADQLLYNYFEDRLAKRVFQFGIDRMDRQLSQLQEDVQRWYSACIETRSTSTDLSEKFKPYSNQVYGFKLRSNATNATCENLAKAELPYTYELRKRQKPYYKVSSLSFEEIMHETYSNRWS